MICRAGGLTQKTVMHILQTPIKPALQLLLPLTIEESEQRMEKAKQVWNDSYHRP